MGNGRHRRLCRSRSQPTATRLLQQVEANRRLLRESSRVRSGATQTSARRSHSCPAITGPACRCQVRHRRRVIRGPSSFQRGRPAQEDAPCDLPHLVGWGKPKQML
mmetsp:Transcript_39173/g.79090  ORF Transcript_39173/g.79090 Transcript_39173/m.79090 type:complete len:106 (+) Transcript_39173:1421-1738(+)